jgi:hypothetical protein
MRDADEWRLPVGEMLDERRARLILTRFSPEARRVGQDLAVRLRAELPDRKVEGKLYGLPVLLHAYQQPRRAEVTGIALGHVADEPRGGGWRVLPLSLKWDSGRVVAPE